MAGRGVVSNGLDGFSSNQMWKLKISQLDSSLDCVFMPSPAKVSLESKTMLSFGCSGGGHGSGKTSLRLVDHEDSGDEYLDVYFTHPEKKRRLSVDQVQFLERSFEAENKLEPERKIQLAKELGLKPRQIAVWFQNRRARWKTRQLETDYEALHTKYECLKTNHNTILVENEKLKAKVLHLKKNVPPGEKKHKLQPEEAKECSRATAKASVPDVNAENAESEAICSAKNNTAKKVGNASTNIITQLSTLEEQSFLGFNELDLPETSVEYLQPDYTFPRIEDAYCHPPVGSFNYGFPIEDHHALGFWSC